MRFGRFAIVAVLAAQQMAAGTKGSPRPFVPKTIVVAKKRLIDISNGPARRHRADLLDVLEGLFTDFGIDAPRLAANDILAGKYRVLKTLRRRDRLALAPVVANVMALFPQETGIVSRLQTELNALEKLQNDENPTVADRAKSLIDMVNESGVVNYSKSTLSRFGRAFIDHGRDGLTAYRNISNESIDELRHKMASLEALAKDENEIVAQRARTLIQIAQRIEVVDISETTAKHMVEVFLKNGRAGLVALRGQGSNVLTLLLERLPALELLSEDRNPYVAKRAKALIHMSKREPTGFSAATTKAIARSFLRNGRQGLEDYQVVSNVRIVQLRKRLPELRRLAQDDNLVVAERAKLLIQVANQDEDIARQSNTLVRYAALFLERGRTGLLEGEDVSEQQLKKLVERIPELEALSTDGDPVIAKWARVLLEVTRGEKPEQPSGTVRYVVHAFLKFGRAGLQDYRPLSDKRRQKLTEKLPELQTLTKDKYVIVAERAELLIRAAGGQGKLGYTGGTVREMADAFFKRGREGLLHYEEISDVQIARLVGRKEELDALLRDGNPLVAERAAILVRIIDRKEVADHSRAWLKTLTRCFLRMGRTGLLDGGLVSERRRKALRKKLPELEVLIGDPNPTVAKRAQQLIALVNGEETVDYKSGTLDYLVRAFIARGRAGLQDYVIPSPRQIARLAEKEDELERLAQDGDLRISNRAKILLRLVRGEDNARVSGSLLKDLSEAFLQRGKPGLSNLGSIGKKLTGRLLARSGELEALSRDADPLVSSRAQVLLHVANREFTDHSISQLRRLAGAFLKGGKAGLEGPLGKAQDRLEAVPELQESSLDDFLAGP